MINPVSISFGRLGNFSSFVCVALGGFDGGFGFTLGGFDGGFGFTFGGGFDGGFGFTLGWGFGGGFTIGSFTFGGGFVSFGYCSSVFDDNWFVKIFFFLGFASGIFSFKLPQLWILYLLHIFFFI